MADASNIPVFQELNLSILVNDLAFSGVFDVLEVWRSPGPGAPFIEITGPSWSTARVPNGAGDQPSVLVPGPQVNVIGKRLSILARSGDLAQLDFDFVGSSAAILKDVAIQITAQSQGRLHSYVDEDAELVVESTAVGSGAYVQVLPTDAASFLGLPTVLPDAEAYGLESRIRLLPGVTGYNFVDLSGSPTATYKTRFRNSFNGATSDYSPNFTGDVAVGISAKNLVVGSISAVASNGRPAPNVQVTVSSTFRGDMVEGSVLIGPDLVDSTDDAGYVEFVLVRGQKYTVGIAGTNLVKDVVAPTDLSIALFSMLDPAFSKQNDYFKVRVPDLPTLERRSI